MQPVSPDARKIAINLANSAKNAEQAKTHPRSGGVFGVRPAASYFLVLTAIFLGSGSGESGTVTFKTPPSR